MSTYRYPGTSASSYKKEILLTLVGIMASIGCAIVGANTATRSFQRYAVEAGHAEYYLDSNHERQWRWKAIK